MYRTYIRFMDYFDRTRKNPIYQWWHRVDRHILFTVIVLILFGIALVSAASPRVAERIGLTSWHFVRQQMFWGGMGFCMLIGASFLSRPFIKTSTLAGFVVLFILLMIVPIVGEEIKGARRWIRILGFSLQPSEILKPFFITINAWILSIKSIKFNGLAFSILLYIAVAIMLVIQPDVGMFSIFSAVWGIQIFLSIEKPMRFIVMGILLASLFVPILYHAHPHVKNRIDTFLEGSKESNYQASKSVEAIIQGGFIGEGLGEGTKKHEIPEAHTDSIFAVLGEEFGSLFCIGVAAIFTFLVFRCLYKVKDEEDDFIVFGSIGLISAIGIQAMVNMGVALNILPTTGMTLPFLSYGGSSMISSTLSLGLILALTKKRYKYQGRKNLKAIKA